VRRGLPPLAIEADPRTRASSSARECDDSPLPNVSIRKVGGTVGVPFCNTGHPPADIPPQGIQVLRDDLLIGPHMPDWYLGGLATALPLDAIAARNLATEARGVEFDDDGEVRTLVEQTDAIAVAPFETIRADVEPGEPVVLGVPDDQEVLLEPRPMVIATLEERELPSVAAVVIEARQIRG